MMGTWDVEIHYLLVLYVSFPILSMDLVVYTTRGNLMWPDRLMDDEARRSLR